MNDADFVLISNDYLSGLSAQQVADKYGIGLHSVYYNLKKHNINRRSNKVNSRKYPVNHNFFNDINNEFNAYWLGFMFADGHVAKYHRSSGKMFVSAEIKDTKHILDFRNDLGATNPLGQYQSNTTYGLCNYVRLVVSSDQLYDDLVRHGCVERKSLVLGAPNNVPEHLERHFIRGYLDGDGSLRLARTSKAGIDISFIGTWQFLSWIKSRFNTNTEVRESKRDPGIYYFSLNFTEEVWRYLYEDSSRSLFRKAERAKHGINRIQKNDCDCKAFCSPE